ncbi:MAG: phosphonopyruvate decarboxylase [Myxococcales bacterium]|nr:MAG: phosphonopyruvate decarboxylase [Myxococcales bacterium]
MIEAKDFFDALVRENVDFFAGVPDSLLKSFCAYITANTDAKHHVITANEGSAVALAAGYHLATGRIGLVYMQNSGLGNAVNPLTSLADAEVYGVPMLLVIGWRGEPDKKDEPQHVKMGKVTSDLLSSINIPHAVVPTDWSEAKPLLKFAIEQATSKQGPFALVVPKGTFETYSLKTDESDSYPLSREDALGIILDHIDPKSFFVSTTGMPSRELYECREQREEEHATDFLTVGSMGHASQIALGVALQQSERPVVCIDGDGAAIMHLGGLSTIGSLKPGNFTHVVLNNGAHDSVGGQPTVGFEIDFAAIARGCAYPTVLRADDENTLAEALNAMAELPGPRFLEVRVHKGARSDLGRPKQSPQELKESIMEFLAKS